MDAHIREATESDLPTIVDLSKRWEREDITAGLRANGPADVAPFLGPFCLVAQRDSEIVGYAMGRVVRSDESLSSILEPGTDYLEISDLYVAPGHRSRRIGHTLMEGLLAAAEKRDVHVSHLFSMTRDQDRVVSFYRSLGYEPYSVSMVRKGKNS